MIENSTVQTRTGETLLIRKLHAGDREALQAFDENLSPNSHYLFFPHGYDDATVDTYIERSVTQRDLAFLALADERIVAYFFLWNYTDPIPMLGIGVTDEYQGAGLGGQFMEMLITAAKDTDRDGIELTTNVTNDRAYQLYLKFGFQYLGDVDNVVGDGTLLRERAMFLPLKPGAKPPDHPHAPPV